MARKTKQELKAAEELARLLYDAYVPNGEIADRVGVSAQTISAWVDKNSWKEKRAAKTVTRGELVNKTLERIHEFLQADNGINADALAKLASLIEKLDKKNSPVASMDVFIAFGQWLNMQSTTEKELTLDFVKTLNKYQDAYISSLMHG
ncbi:MAG: putative DNA-binding transcriptional regulator [Bacteroidales bacterium]|nr:putative DNA-binding transcriptional regulator [Bacteroidales bacterium]